MEIKSAKTSSQIQKVMKEFWKKKIDFSKVKPVSIEPVWFYLNEKEIIGFINGSIPDSGHWKSAKITNLEIKENFQKNGYSKQLMNKFIEDCKINNVSSISLRVEKDNLLAKLIYDKYQFKVDKEGIIMDLSLK